MNIILIIIAVIIVLVIVFLVATYNSLVSLRNQVEEAFSTMDVYLVKRYDLIPNLVETVKGYAKHEAATFESVIAARNTAVSANTLDEKVAAQGELQQTLSRLFALSENYPELKANVNFLDLQKQLQTIELEISQARKYYNGVVRMFNTKLEVFPSNVVAGMFKFTRKPLFVVDDETQRQNVKVQF